MRCGIPLMGERVAPRCTAADTLLVVSVSNSNVTKKSRISVSVEGLVDLIGILRSHRIDTLVCGGISSEAREAINAEAVEVVHNVACSVDEIFPALERGALRSGFGLSLNQQYAGQESPALDRESPPRADKLVDCISCPNPVCLSGENCKPEIVDPGSPLSVEVKHILEAAADVSLEKERRLCRLSELIYFCIEMKYNKIGLAYCTDLQEPAQILTGVFRRFFNVIPVCCKIGGSSLDSSDQLDGDGPVACNPVGQAQMLNNAGTDFNVLMGLCVGVDTVFTRYSEAPVSTLFVKDKSLANNPIGALYSEYYLKESLSPALIKGSQETRSASEEH